MRHAAEFALGALTVVVVWALLNLAAAIADARSTTPAPWRVSTKPAGR
jgi:hypothetical protein